MSENKDTYRNEKEQQDQLAWQKKVIREELKELKINSK